MAVHAFLNRILRLPRARHVVVGVVLLSMLLGGLGWWFRPTIARLLAITAWQRSIEGHGGAAVLAAVPAPWVADPRTEGESVSVGFAEFRLNEPRRWMADRRAVTCVLLERDDARIWLIGPSRIQGGEVLPDFFYALAGTSLPEADETTASRSHLWRSMLTLASVAPKRRSELLSMPAEEFEAYIAASLVKLSGMGRVVARMQTDDVDSIVEEIGGPRGRELHASVASATTDLMVGLSVSAGSPEAAQQLMRSVLSSFRFTDSGWTDEQQLAAQIESNLAGWPGRADAPR